MIYLAYQADEKQFTKDRILKIVNEFWYDNYLEKRLQKTFLFEKQDSTKSFLQIVSEGEFSWGLVKTLPWTPISFKYHYNKDNATCPENFTGLNIYPNHASSEDYLQVLGIKPMIDAYLSIMGIKWTDRHKLEI